MVLKLVIKDVMVLFADDIVVIVPTAKKLQQLLRCVLHLVNINEMYFGIEKYVTMVIKGL